MKVHLKNKLQVAEGTMAFWFDAPEMTFEAGQNVDLTLINPPLTDAEGNKRTFSFASSPTHKGEFMIATRMRNTAFKNVLKDSQLGTQLKADGPNGDMTLHEDAVRPAVLMAGGIGITPFRSMIEWATVTKQPQQIYLLYSNRTTASTAFLKDFEAWAQQNTNFHFVPTITEGDDREWQYERGKMDAAFVQKHIPNLGSSIFYMAGPGGMVEAMKDLLKGLGVKKDAMRSETFKGY